MVFTSAVMLYSEPAFAASKKTSISKKKVTLTVGKTYKLKIKNARNKVKWSTTNKKIVKISKKSGKKKQNAVIKAGKKTGTCYIKAKVGKKTYKCKVTVKKKKKTSDEGDSGNDGRINRPGENPVDTEEVVIETREISSSSVNLSDGLVAEAPAEAEPDAEFINGFAGFSVELMQQVIAADRAEGKNASVLISPDSVATAMAMVENGADGQTLAEMEDVLLPGISADDYNKYLSTVNRRLASGTEYIFNTANSIWARENMVDVRQDFLQVNKNYHDAEFYVAPFSEQTVSDMNSWVYNNTRNMIDNIIAELSKDARMVLINTVAFDGKWEMPFDSRNKQDMPFTAYNGTKKNVTMLRDTGEYQYFELDGGKACVKYYKGSAQNGGIAFVGILPPQGVDADAFIAGLDGTDFISAWNSRKLKTVRLIIPKFKNDYSCDMGALLQGMGMTTAFTDGADFSRMADPTPETPGLKISKVLHKTHIDFDENGTKAAAATAVVMEKATAIMGEEPIVMQFDRPFVYALVDTQTGIPLFLGEVRSVD